MAVLVLLGDIRVLMSSANFNCQNDCMSFSQRPVLGPGDICECCILFTVYNMTVYVYYARKLVFTCQVMSDINAQVLFSSKLGELLR